MLKVDLRWLLKIKFSPGLLLLQETFGIIIPVSDLSRAFLSRPVHTLKPQRHQHGWYQLYKFPKPVPPDTPKMHSLDLFVLRFLCKTFFKLLLVYITKNFPSWMIFKKLIYSNKKFVWLQTCESCKTIWAEKMQHVVQQESHEAVWTIYII